MSHVSLHEIRKVLQAGAPGLQLINKGENLQAGGLVAAEVGFGALAVQLINVGQVLVAQVDQILSNLPHGGGFVSAFDNYTHSNLTGGATGADVLRLASAGDKVLGLPRRAISLQQYSVPNAVGASTGLLVHVADFVPHHKAIQHLFHNSQTIQSVNNAAAEWNFAAAEFNAGVPVLTIAQQLINFFTQ